MGRLVSTQKGDSRIHMPFAFSEYFFEWANDWWLHSEWTVNRVGHSWVVDWPGCPSFQSCRLSSVIATPCRRLHSHGSRCKRWPIELLSVQPEQPYSTALVSCILTHRIRFRYMCFRWDHGSLSLCVALLALNLTPCLFIFLHKGMPAPWTS